MNKKFIIIIAVVVVAALVIASTVISWRSPEKKIIGQWSKEGYDYVAFDFFGDGGVYGDNISGGGKWYLEGDRLKIETRYDSEVYEIEFDGKDIILDGERYVRNEKD